MPGELSVIGAVLDENGNTCPVKTAFANVAASATDSALVAAVAGKRIRVLAYLLQAGSTATTVTFNSKPAGAGSPISAQFQNAANGGVERTGGNGIYYFQTAVGEGLSVTTGAGSTTGISVVYCEV